MDRLSPLDASFLHIEDDVNHMHIGSIGIFEGPPPTYEDLTTTVGGRLALSTGERGALRIDASLPT